MISKRSAQDSTWSRVESSISKSESFHTRVQDRDHEFEDSRPVSRPRPRPDSSTTTLQVSLKAIYCQGCEQGFQVLWWAKIHMRKIYGTHADSLRNSQESKWLLMELQNQMILCRISAKNLTFLWMEFHVSKCSMSKCSMSKCSMSKCSRGAVITTYHYEGD